MDLHVYLHIPQIDEVLSKLEKIMATLDQVLADVTAESTALDSVAALIAGLQKQNKGKIAAALAANVPPPPAP